MLYYVFDSMGDRDWMVRRGTFFLRWLYVYLTQRRKGLAEATINNQLSTINNQLSTINDQRSTIITSLGSKERGGSLATLRIAGFQMDARGRMRSMLYYVGLTHYREAGGATEEMLFYKKNQKNN